VKNSEKINLLAIFFLTFSLVATLFYLMIKTDLQKEVSRGEPRQDDRQENIWPKVEIQTKQ
jgi:hypothetical protein